MLASSENVKTTSIYSSILKYFSIDYDLAANVNVFAATFLLLFSGKCNENPPKKIRLLKRNIKPF